MPIISQSVQFSRSVISDSLQPHGRQAFLSITNSQSLLKLISIELMIPSNHLILCRALLLLPSIFPCIMFFSNKSGLHIRWPKYWSFSFRISPSCIFSRLVVCQLLHLLLSSPNQKMGQRTK